MKDQKVYFNQILDSIRKIESFIGAMDKKQFMADEKTQSAVVIQLMLIGEVSKRIDAEIKNKIDLPWKDISGFRDKAIHHYFEIDLDLVWKTVEKDIPYLKEKIKKGLREI